jgi:plasmid stabilization system protein ParE
VKAVALKVSRRAAQHIRTATAWWAKNRLAAPGAVTAAVEQGAAHIQERPHGVGTRISHTRLGEVRRLYLSRIHYYLYFRISVEDIEIIALWHASRGSEPPI